MSMIEGIHTKDVVVFGQGRKSTIIHFLEPVRQVNIVDIAKGDKIADISQFVSAMKKIGMSCAVHSETNKIICAPEITVQIYGNDFKEFLQDREDDIASDIENFGLLKETFKKVFDRNPKM